MIDRESAGRTLQAAAVQHEPPAEFPVVADAAPAVGQFGNRLPDLGQRFGFRPPQAHGQEALAGAMWT